MKVRFFSLFSCLFFFLFAQAQDTKRQFDAVKITSSIHVDGIADDDAWTKATILTDFIQWEGDVGDPASLKTEAKVLYSNKAIYIFAKSYDKRENIRRELAERDDIGNADFFGVILDPFLSGIDAFEFIVSAAGTQFDAKVSQNGEDSDWDAVWDSAVKIDDDG